MRASLVALVVATVAGFGVPRAAYAGAPLDRPEAIEVDRDDTPPGRVELGFDGGAPVGAWGASIGLGLLDRPLVLRTPVQTIVPVDHRETLTFGGYFALGDRAVVDVRLPLAHQIGARLAGLGDDTPLKRFVHGELAFGARLRVVERGAIAAFLRGELVVPTGDSFDFAGAPSWSAAWLLVGRASLPRGIVIAATAGIRLRGREVIVADRVVGDELVGGLGVIVPLPPIARLWCVRDQLKLTAELVGVLGDNVGLQRGPSPAEARFGVVGAPRANLTIGARVGVGLVDEHGAPRFRALVEVAWQASAPPPQPKRPVVDEELD